jgi:hypothetical protein
MRNRSEFKRAQTKRRALHDAGLLSQPDGPGARVAVLMPFVQGLVQDPRDGFDSFERDAEALVKEIESNDREAVVRMRATVADFEDVVNDATVATVIVRGWPAISSSAGSWFGRAAA